MEKKTILRRLVVLCLVCGLILTGAPALNVTAESANYSIYTAAVKSYCDLSGESFTVTDVRTGEKKTYDGSAGKNAVFVYGSLGTIYMDDAVSILADMMHYLDTKKLDVFIMDKTNNDENSIRASATQLDPDRVLIVSKYEREKDDVLSKILVSNGITEYYTPFIVYVNSNGGVYTYTESQTSMGDILDKLEAGGIDDTYSGRNISPCDLSKDSFNVTDIRTGKKKTFDGRMQKNAVFVYGAFGYSSFDNTVSKLSDIMSFLDRTKLVVFVQSSNDESSIRKFAEQLDSDGDLIVSKWEYTNDVFLKVINATVGYGNSINEPLVVYVNSSGNVYAYTTGSTSVDRIMDYLVAGGIEDTYRGRTISPNVETHTVKEIRQFVNEHPVTFAEPVYTENPSAAQPYNLGKVSAASLQDGLNAVNQIRYIAGLSHDITLEDNYTQLAQAASLVNAAIGQKLSHHPSQPQGMGDELYQQGYKGASSSNISGGRHDIAATVVYGYMNDGDPSNINVVGHRRWVLNPTMAKTGFGFVKAESSYYGTYSAMYAFDNSGKEAGTVSMWPALNTPVEYFSSDYPWSYSTGNSEYIGKVKVTLTNTNTGEVMEFSATSSDGYFYVNNERTGLSGCIIFRPENVTYETGDKYHVKIEGLSANMTVEYDVNFFSLDNPQDDEEEEPEIITAGMMFRLYNPNSGEHFYTANVEERNKLKSLGWKYEGSAWNAPEKSNLPVYRLYNPNSGEHHYTMSSSERDILIGLGWNDEGIGWYSDESQGTPLYRLYNPGAVGQYAAGAHHYTKDVNEKNSLIAAGWNDEGIGWYGK